jgi:hypothetical protein
VILVGGGGGNRLSEKLGFDSHDSCCCCSNSDSCTGVPYLAAAGSIGKIAGNKRSTGLSNLVCASSSSVVVSSIVLLLPFLSATGLLFYNPTTPSFIRWKSPEEHAAATVSSVIEIQLLPFWSAVLSSDSQSRQ